MPTKSPTSKQKFRAFFEVLGKELDRSHPGIFEWRFGNPATAGSECLIITKSDVKGYVSVTAMSKSENTTVFGALEDGYRHVYMASVVGPRGWNLPDADKSPLVCLEAFASAEPADIVERLVKEWAFERPWIAPSPIDPKAEKKRLQRIVTGLNTRDEIPIIINISPDAELGLTPQSRAALEHDLSGLLPQRIRYEFPSDERGLIALKTGAILASYDTIKPLASTKRRCIVASGPLFRSEAQEIRISLGDLFPENQDHNWERQRWRWHADEQAADRDSQWGAPLPIELIAAGKTSSAKLEKIVAAGTANQGEKAALAMLMQEEGRLLESLELYEIEVSEELRRLCGRQKIYPPGCCSYASEKWVQRLHDCLRASAPWLMREAPLLEAQRLEAWAAEKKSRRRRRPTLKLFIFPGQHHSRKDSLILTSADLEGTQPRLEIQTTGSNTRLHESGWIRPLSLELARYDLV